MLFIRCFAKCDKLAGVRLDCVRIIFVIQEIEYV